MKLQSPPRLHPHLRRAIAALAPLLILPACAPAPNAQPDESTSTALAELAPTDPTPTAGPSEGDLTELLAASTAALDQLYATGAMDRPAPPAPAPTESDPTDTDLAVAEPEPVEDIETPADPPPSLDARILDLATELGVLIRERAESHADFAPALPTLAALDALGADGLDPWLDPDLALLAPNEAEAAARLRTLHRLLTENPDAAPAALATLADELRAAQPVRIADARLCTRVEGFGRYTDYPDAALLAGRDHRLIIYTEVDSFDRTPLDTEGTPLPTPGPDATALPAARYRVEISQELLLYHDADGLLAWRRPAEVSRYESRAPLRDFFLTDPVALPRTLTVGSYHLKVVVRDRADGSTDERILPIRVVADPNLAKRR